MFNLLGVRIDNLDLVEALKKAELFLCSSTSHKIFTPNPEMLVDAQKDSLFKKILNKSDINLCDGFGIQLVSPGKTNRVTGVDFTLALCGLAERMGKSIYLLGSGLDEVVGKTAEVLQKKYPNLKIAGFNKGPKIQIVDYELQAGDENNLIISDIISKSPDILLVAFGHNKQEKWIEENLPKLPPVRVAVGVGGSFDYISGKVSRAPLFLRQIGLEWMYRLIKEPRRIKRIFKATFWFLYLYYVKQRHGQTN